MIAKSVQRTAGAAVALTLLAATALYAQDRIKLSGTYQIEKLNADTNAVTMNFTATITNNGPKDLSGKIALNDPAVIQKIFTQFGDQSIPAGKSVKINDNVTVPREEYNGWLSRGPNLTFYAQNDRGEMKTFRIPMSGKAPAPKN